MLIFFLCFFEYALLILLGISMAVDDDNYFELMIRNALMPAENENGVGRFNSNHATARRVLVVHSNGVEEIVG